ncbi:MAG: Gfo/Idh/MocA family protein [Lachnospiraceae bacterium]
MLKIGVIGCGMITKVRHAPEYNSNPNCKLVAFYDCNMEKAKELAAEYNAKYCESVEELLALDLDAVSVCVANNAHAQITIQALMANLHVLCEKPMALTLHDCEEMVRIAKKANKTLMIGHNQRFAPTHLMAKELISQGEIGKVLSFETKFGHSGPEMWTGNKDTWFFDKSSSGFGVMADLGIHKIDLAHFILGDPIVSVSAMLTTLDKRKTNGELIEVDDNAICIFKTQNGAFGSLHVSWTFYGNEKNSFVAYGTQGVIRCYDDSEHSLIIEKEGSTSYYDLDVLTKNTDQTIGIRKNTGVIDEFVTSILEQREPLTSGVESLKAMKVVFAALRAHFMDVKIDNH